METDDFNYKELVRDALKELNNEFDTLTERAERLKGYQQLLEKMDEVFRENEKLRDEKESLKQQVVELGKQKEALEMKEREMSKLSAGMAKTSSEEAVMKALRTYANRSKRKTADKRVYAKTAILEIANVNSLVLPDDLAAIVECLDDDQAESKVVNVQGNYNDIHDNGEVKFKG